MAKQTREVGSPDPSRRNSPFFASSLEAMEVPNIAEPRSDVCLFNNETFEEGSELLSGEVLLRCEQGAWIIQPH